MSSLRDTTAFITSLLQTGVVVHVSMSLTTTATKMWVAICSIPHDTTFTNRCGNLYDTYYIGH